MDHTSRIAAAEHALVCPVEDRRRFDRAVQSTPSLADLRERGSAVLRPFPRLLTDVFCFFYSPHPVLADESASVDRLHHLIVKYLFDSSEYQQLRRQTALQFDASLMAAEQFARRLVEHLQARAPSGGPHQATSDGIVHITGITFADTVTPRDGSSLDAALLVIATEIESQADSLRLLTDLCRQWGQDPGFLQRLPHEERSALARRIGETQKLQDLARLVGRLRDLAMHKQRARIAELPHEVYDVTLGDDWDRLLPNELTALAHPLLRFDFYERLLDGRVSQYHLRGEESLDRGTIVACLDTSGSMAGSNELVSKAIALALLDVARLQNRHCVVILFSSPGQWRSFTFPGDGAAVRDPGGQPTAVSVAEAIVRVGSEFFGGGTDYQSPLEEAMRLIAEDEAADGDIVFITDDQCEVNAPFLERYRALKAAKRFSTYSVIVGAQASEARTLKTLSDQVIAASELTDEVAGRIFEKV